MAASSSTNLSDLSFQQCLEIALGFTINSTDILLDADEQERVRNAINNARPSSQQPWDGKTEAERFQWCLAFMFSVCHVKRNHWISRGLSLAFWSHVARATRWAKKGELNNIIIRKLAYTLIRPYEHSSKHIINPITTNSVRTAIQNWIDDMNRLRGQQNAEGNKKNGDKGKDEDQDEDGGNDGDESKGP